MTGDRVLAGRGGRMLRTFLLIATLLALGALAAVQAQSPPDATGVEPPATPVAPAPEKVSLILRGLAPGEVFRLGPAGAELQEHAATSEEIAQVELELGKSHQLRWGDT